MNTFFIIAGRVLASPIVNVFQKKLTNRDVSPELIVMISYMFFAILSIPIFIIYQPFDLPIEFWIYISLLGVFDIFGNMFLVKSLKTIDLSVFGPLNSFKPVFALVFGGFLLSEVPSLMGMIGVIIIVLGSYFLNYEKEKKTFDWIFNKGIVFRFLAIVLTSIAAVFSKKTILLSSPLITLVYWSLIGWPISMLLVIKLNRSWEKSINVVNKYKWNITWLCVSFLALQLFTLMTFEKIFVGYSLALFQLSSLVSVFFGVHLFKEKNFKYRLVGCLIMLIGTVFIILYS